MSFSGSIELYNRAIKFIPGGVNSPVRAFKAVGGDPVFFEKAEGSKLFDVDGNSFIDYVSSWGPMILGHAHPEVIEEVKKVLDQGTSFGAPTEIEIKIAELITSMAPNIDKVRMVNSGTEACMSAIRLARGFTNKEKIIKFEGCYHGHADPFLIKAGSGASTFGSPNSPGVNTGTVSDTLLARYNDISHVEQIIEKHKGEIAAIILEPVAGNMGCIPPKPGFLPGLRQICNDHKIVLIFDEVMTGFRLKRGGAQEYFGVDADLVTYGKIIGGGMPVGAFGGKEEIMSMVAPEGPVYQAGTLSGNPVAMTCGYHTLRVLNENQHIYSELEEKGKNLEKGLRQSLANKNVEFRINRVGSMISLHFTSKDVIDFETASFGDNAYFKRYFQEMLKMGIYLPPSAYETWFISSALQDDQIDETIRASQQAIENIVIHM